MRGGAAAFVGIGSNKWKRGARNFYFPEMQPSGYMSPMAGVKEQPKRRKSAAEWALIRVAAEAGEMWGELSRKFLISSVAIRGRAEREGWRIPLWERKRGKRESAVSECPTPALQVTDNGNKVAFANDLQYPEVPDLPQPVEPQLLSNLPSDLREALQAVASAPPEGIQAAFGRVSQIVIAQGILEVPPPRNVKELATWFAIFQKAHGLDKPKDSGAKDAGLFGSRGGFRRVVGPVVEAMPAAPAEAGGDDDGADGPCGCG